MRCKVLTVPLDSEAALDCERKLDRFMDANNVKRIFASLADQAAQESVPLYMVAQNRWLEEIVRMPVRALEDLKHVVGFGEWRVQKYGPTIVEVLHASNVAKRSWQPSSYSAGRA